MYLITDTDTKKIIAMTMQYLQERLYCLKNEPTWVPKSIRFALLVPPT